MKRILLLVSISSFLVGTTLLPRSFAAIQATITVEQVSPKSLGSWTMLFAHGETRSSNDAGVNKTNSSFSITDFGPMTFSVRQPPDMETKISLYRNGDLVKTEETTQISFTPLPNASYRFLVQYSLARLGTLGVTSSPSGVRFRMKGPTNRIFTGKSPHTFENIPSGKYTLYFASTEACVQPAPQGAIVKPATRNTTHVDLACAQAEENVVERVRKSKRTIVEEAQNREYKPRGQRK